MKRKSFLLLFFLMLAAIPGRLLARQIPVAVNDTVVSGITEDRTIRVLLNDVPGNSPLDPTSLEIQQGPHFGSVSTFGGKIFYRHNLGFTSPGLDSLSYTVRDETEVLSNVGWVYIEIIDAVSPDEDIYGPGAIGMNTPFTIDVPERFIPGSGELLPETVRVYDGPEHGQVEIDNVNGLVTYIPETDFEGGDDFTIAIENSDGLEAESWITFEVSDQVNDEATAEQGVPVEINVVANDSLGGTFSNDFPPDPDGIFIETESGSGAVLTVQEGGVIVYESAPGFLGTDQFTYGVFTDGGDHYAVYATVTVEVFPFSEPPVAVDDTVKVGLHESRIIRVLLNDEPGDAPLDPATLEIKTQPELGSAFVSGGKIRYSHEPGPVIPELDFSYTVKDLNGKESNEAWVSIEIIDAVSPDEDIYGPGAVGMNTSFTIDVPERFLSGSGDLLPETVRVYDGPEHGQVEIDDVTGLVTYIPETDFEGDDGFYITIENSEGLQSETVIIFEVSNQVNDEATAEQGIPVEINVAANDSLGGTFSGDFPPDPEHIFIETPSANGAVLTIQEAGMIVYEPAADFFGTDQFTYGILTDDGDHYAVYATVTVEVTPVNRPPVAGDIEISTRMNQPLYIDVELYVNDPNDDPITLTEVGDPENGTTEITDNQILYTPGLNFTGTDTFSYSVTDELETDEAMVIVHVVEVAYSVTTLGTLGGGASRAMAVNNNGQVVGMSLNEEGEMRGFSWLNDTMQPFDTGDATQVLAINDEGDVAGAVETNGLLYPAVWSGGEAEVLSEEGIAYGVGPERLLAGVLINDQQEFESFLWDGTGINLTASAAPESFLFQVNQNGVAAGYTEQNRVQRAFHTDMNGQIEFLTDDDISSAVFGLNDSGEFVGTVEESGRFIPALFQEDNQYNLLQDLGGSFAAALSINQDGIIVGTAGTEISTQNAKAAAKTAVAELRPGSDFFNNIILSPENKFKASATAELGMKAVVWINGLLVDLNETIPNTGEWELLEARSINNAGQIVGYGLYNNEIRAFFLNSSVNNPPKIVRDKVTINPQGENRFNILDFVEDDDGDQISLVSVSQGKLGSITNEGDGVIIYQPYTEASGGRDEFEYVVTDGRGAHTEGTLNIEFMEIPAEVALLQNYPNPFGGSSVIRYELPEMLDVAVVVYDVLGRKIQTLVEDTIPAGTHTVEFDGNGFASGVYLYRLSAGDKVFTKKMVLIR